MQVERNYNHLLHIKRKKNETLPIPIKRKGNIQMLPTKDGKTYSEVSKAVVYEKAKTERFDNEWAMLIKEAIDIGIRKEEVRRFLKQK